MLSIGLSLNSGIKMLERTLKFRVSSFFQEEAYTHAPAAKAIDTKAVAAATSVDNTVGLKIAKTVMPEERMNFNQTFLHIRQELDGYYKERNPIFSNTTTPELWQQQKNSLN